MDEQEEKHKGSLCSGLWRKEAPAFEESFHSEKWFAKTLQRLPRSLGEL